MRRILIFLLFTTMALGTVRSVSASTDCSKWIAEYRQKLENQAQVRRALLAKRRLHAYLKKTIATYTKPKPRVLRASGKPRPRRPRMSPQEMLKRFKIVCGDLPDEPVDGPLLPVDPLPALLLTSSFPTEGNPIVALDNPPVIPPVQTNNPPVGNTPGTPGFPGPPIYPPVGPPTIPPTPPVPEPSSILLLASGALGLAKFAWQKRGNAESKS